jgi:predicted RNA polymerase sigma factor
VLKTIYLLFNEGYNSSNPDALIRRDLCEEAIRLCYILTKNSITNLPKTNALMSLMCFQTSRFEARLDEDNNIILLKNQNRNKWDKLLIMNGLAYLDKASKGEELSEYHLEAAIASYHAKVESFEQTNWQAIYYLYQLLAQINKSPVIEFNKAIAQSFVEGASQSIETLKRIEGLENSQYYHTALGDFYEDLNEKKLAKISYEKAINLTKSKVEWKLIWEKIEKL